MLPRRDDYEPFVSQTTLPLYILNLDLDIFSPFLILILGLAPGVQPKMPTFRPELALGPRSTRRPPSLDRQQHVKLPNDSRRKYATCARFSYERYSTTAFLSPWCSSRNGTASPSAIYPFALLSPLTSRRANTTLAFLITMPFLS